MAHVTVINEHQYVQQIVSGHHRLTADQAANGGSSEAGWSPAELMLSGLGACTAIAVRKHALGKGWSLGKVTVGLRLSREGGNGEHIERRISFTRPATAEQRAELLQIIEQTPLSRLLSKALPIRSELLEQS